MFLLIDLDNFKKINDNHGHLVGDEVLVDVTSRLKRISRATDLLVRWGGDELLLVRWDADPKAGAAMAERVRLALCGTPLTTTSGLELSVSCTVGFACFPFLRTQPDFLPWEQVLAMADCALYDAKERRNAWVGYQSTAESATVDDIMLTLRENARGLAEQGQLEILRSKIASQAVTLESNHDADQEKQVAETDKLGPVADVVV